MKRTILFIICTLLTISVFLCSCAKNDKKTSGSETSEPGNVIEQNDNYINDAYGKPSVSTQFDVSANVTGTTHIFNSSDTNYKIVENGKSDYVILLPSDANDFESYAAGELQYFFRESTGILLPVETEGQGELSAKGYLSVGKTSLRNDCGVAFDYETLGDNGYKIVTYGKSVIMSGYGKQGTLYAVYEFLHQVFNWETFGPDCTVYDKNVKEVKLRNYNVTDVPDIPWRQVTGGLLFNSVYARRLRYNQPGEIMAYPGGWCHNTFHAVPPSQYADSHPEWYSRDLYGNLQFVDGKDSGQLCYSCESEERMEIILNAITSWLKASPDVENISFSQQDNTDWCECEECSASYRKYGTHSAVLIQFINKLYDRLEPWLVENDRHVTLSFFAYLQTEDAPVKIENGKYVPIDESVVCKENVGVMFAPIGADYSKSFADPSNSSEYENLAKWEVLTKKMYLWSYQTDFRAYLCPYNTFNSMQANYKLAYLNNTFWLLDQQQSWQNNCTAFNIFKYYLASKLAWNVNEDISELTDRFFDNYFGPASSALRQLFEELRARFSYIENDLNIDMFIYVQLENKSFWPEGLLVQWLDYINKAYAAIDGLKETDEDNYYLIKDRILLESISYRYLLIELYGTTYYDAETLQREKLQWKADCSYLGISRQRESVMLVDWLAENWGV